MTETEKSRPIGKPPITDAGTDNAGPVDRAENIPELFNSEQDDEAAQAQTVSDDAIHAIANRSANLESEHGGTTNPAQIDPDDTQDVLDHMNQMERSGKIDMDAYRAERSDDDEPDSFGESALEPDDIDSCGNRGGTPDPNV
ncbi:MAG: hypothetical protein ACK519_03430 [Sphingomonadaceae bacterium]